MSIWDCRLSEYANYAICISIDLELIGLLFWMIIVPEIGAVICTTTFTFTLPEVKRSRLASSQLVMLQVLQYMTTTKRSICFMQLSGILWGLYDNVTSMSVMAGYASHASHAVFLPILPTVDLYGIWTHYLRHTRQAKCKVEHSDL